MTRIVFPIPHSATLPSRPLSAYREDIANAIRIPKSFCVPCTSPLSSRTLWLTWINNRREEGERDDDALCCIRGALLQRKRDHNISCVCLYVYVCMSDVDIMASFNMKRLNSLQAHERQRAAQREGTKSLWVRFLAQVHFLSQMRILVSYDRKDPTDWQPY